MWQPVILSQVWIKNIFVCPEGMWIVRSEESFFVSNKKRGIGAVCEHTPNAILGAVDNVLFFARHR